MFQYVRTPDLLPLMGKSSGEVITLDVCSGTCVDRCNPLAVGPKNLRVLPLPGSDVEQFVEFVVLQQ